MTNKPNLSAEYNEELHCGLTPQEIHEWLSGLQSGNFPMRLLTKWVKSPWENGYNDWIAITEKNERYKNLKQWERDLISTLPSRWVNHNREDQSVERLGVYHSIVDIWCGDGKTSKHFMDHIYKSEDARHKQASVTLIDNSWLAIQHASELLGPAVKDVLLKDLFSPSIHINSKESDRVLCINFGGMRWNLSQKEQEVLQEKIWLNTTSLKSVYKMPHTPEGRKATLKAYGADPDGDNSVGHEVCKQQVRNMLDVLWFSAEDRQNCDFEARFSHPDSNGNAAIQVWFIPQRDIVIQYQWISYEYKAWMFCQAFISQRFSVESFEKSPIELPKTRRYVTEIRENETSLIVLERNELTKKAAVKENLIKTLNLGGFIASTLTILFWILFKIWLINTRGERFSTFSKKGKEEFEYMLTRKWIHDVSARDSLVAYTMNLTHFFSGAFNEETSRSASQTWWLGGTVVLSDEMIENALIPAIENILVSNTLDSSLREKSFFDVAKDILDKNGASFYMAGLKDPKWWLTDARSSFNELFTAHAPDSVLKSIKHAFLYAPYKDFELSDRYNDAPPNTPILGATYKYQMYNEKGIPTYVYEIKRQPGRYLERDDAYWGGAMSTDNYSFFLYVPVDFKQRFSSREEVIDYSVKLATEVYSFKAYFAEFRDGPKEWF
jgi:hypothetical protein